MSDAPRSATPGSPDPEFWGRSDKPDHPGGLPPRSFEAGSLLERLTDRMRDWRTDPRVGVGALIVVALVAGVVWYRIGAAAPSTDHGSRPVRSPGAARSAPESRSTATSAAAAGDRVTVHVAGAVTKPGVYELKAGARVIDAVEAAGGGLPDADLERLNLAAKVPDGQRVLVQRPGDPPAAPPPGAPGDGSTGPADPAGLVNLNSSTQAELEALPGIGPSLAQAIIAERARRGGFRSVNELREVRGIGDKRFADLKDKVTV